MRDALDDDGVYVEPEPERGHAGDGTAARPGVNRSDPAGCYSAGEDGAAGVVGASR